MLCIFLDILNAVMSSANIVTLTYFLFLCFLFSLMYKASHIIFTKPNVSFSLVLNLSIEAVTISSLTMVLAIGYFADTSYQIKEIPSGLTLLKFFYVYDCRVFPVKILRLKLFIRFSVLLAYL